MIFMSKEMNKKTGLTKLEKENIGYVSGGDGGRSHSYEMREDGSTVLITTIFPPKGSDVPIGCIRKEFPSKKDLDDFVKEQFPGENAEPLKFIRPKKGQ